MRKIVPMVAIASFVAIAFVSFGAKSADVTTTEGGFKQVEEIDMVLQRRVVRDTLEMKATSPGLGWISVGFDADMLMKGADYVIGYVSDGEGSIATMGIRQWATNWTPFSEEPTM